MMRPAITRGTAICDLQPGRRMANLRPGPNGGMTMKTLLALASLLALSACGIPLVPFI